MAGTTVIFGNGTIGHLVAERLLQRGDRVRIAQRNAPVDLPSATEFVRCDILDAASVQRAVAGASNVLLAVSFAYDSRVWRRTWPVAMSNVVEACAATDARIVFIDNLYQLGPQTTPRTETMPLTSLGKKPAILAETTRIWLAA